MWKITRLLEDILAELQGIRELMNKSEVVVEMDSSILGDKIAEVLTEELKEIRDEGD